MRWATPSALFRLRIMASFERSSDSLAAASCANARKVLTTTPRRHPEISWIADHAGRGSHRVGAASRPVAAVVVAVRGNRVLPRRKVDRGALAEDLPAAVDGNYRIDRRQSTVGGQRITANALALGVTV